jgi:hypothetical protein
MFLGSRARPVRMTDNLTTIWADCLDNVGSLTSNNPIGLHGLLRGIAILYFYFTFSLLVIDTWGYFHGFKATAA